ncbi:MAG: Aspartyl-tRNA(Asn) amidotransferase subunit B / Glutamyl-tRNA(Gln) amidotransferase subunit B, partial [Parcubacteria group bacterium Gr01-1014_66]
MQYEPVIGLEIHIELNTSTKMFCRCRNDSDERHPNMHICPICMGHPGALPYANEVAVHKIIRTGLTLGGHIAPFSEFERKNYFYPDLPKGYQISQYLHPLVVGGGLIIGKKHIRIQRIHLEEDTGRLLHEGGPSTSSGRSATLIDFNRAGIPLMELVTEPDFTSGEEVKQFGEELQQIIRYLNVSDADMEKGQMRVEVNISLRPEGTKELGTKVEVKNINSFRFAEAAVVYETSRQKVLLDAGEKVQQETRGWDEQKGITFPQRSKEEAHDYRYFPEPDLPPLEISDELIEELRASLPELPHEKAARFMREYGLDEEMSEILTRDHKGANYFESIISELDAYESTMDGIPRAKRIHTAVGFFTGDFMRLLNESLIHADETRITPEN